MSFQARDSLVLGGSSSSSAGKSGPCVPGGTFKPARRSPSMARPRVIRGAFCEGAVRGTYVRTRVRACTRTRAARSHVIRRGRTYVHIHTYVGVRCARPLEVTRPISLLPSSTFVMAQKDSQSEA